MPNAPMIIQKIPSILPFAVQAAITFVSKLLIVGLHNDIGDIINDALQARRQADAHNVAQDRQRKADIPQTHAVQRHPSA